MILRPDEEESLIYMDRANWSRRNWKRISSTVRELSVALLDRITKDSGTEPLWKDDHFACSPYRHKTLSCGVSLITCRDKLEFPGGLNLKHIVEVVVCSEQSRDGRDYAVIDGIEFHDENGLVGYLGRRHGESTTGSQSSYYLEDGDMLAGFVASQSHEGFIALQLIRARRNGTDEALLETVLREQGHERVGTLSISPGASLHRFEATFLGVSPCSSSYKYMYAGLVHFSDDNRNDIALG